MPNAINQLNAELERLNSLTQLMPETHQLDKDAAQSFYNMLSLILLDNVLKSMPAESIDDFKTMLLDFWRQHVVEESIALMSKQQVASVDTEPYLNLLNDSLSRVEPFLRDKLAPLGTYEEPNTQGDTN